MVSVIVSFLLVSICAVDKFAFSVIQMIIGIYFRIHQPFVYPAIDPIRAIIIKNRGSFPSKKYCNVD